MTALEVAEARAAAWEFITRAAELERLGAWGTFVAQNRELLADLKRKIEA